MVRDQPRGASKGDRVNGLPILKINDAVEFYRYMAVAYEMHTLSGRGHDRAATEFANSRILAALDLDPGDVVLDIGCGDGCLLRLASLRAARCIGVVPTTEEQRKLESALPQSEFICGLAQRLPLESSTASKIVCNGVLLLLRDEDNVLAALREIARVARIGATVFLGEIPAANEYECSHVYSGTSIAGLLWNRWRYKGTRTFLTTAKSAWKSWKGSETLVLNSYGLYHASPERFINLAEQCGLRLQTYFKHIRLHQSGQLMESPYRYNYIFSN